MGSIGSMNSFADQRDINLVVRLTNRFILAFFSASVGLVSVFLLRLGQGPSILKTPLDTLIGYSGLIAATILGLRIIVAITREME